MATSKDSPTAGELNNSGDAVPAEHLPHSIPVEPTQEEQELAEGPVVPATEDDVKREGEAGEIWAIWKGMQPGERGLTVADLRSLGDKETTEELWWNPGNRWKVEVTDAHPMVLKYLEEDDAAFEIVRL